MLKQNNSLNKKPLVSVIVTTKNNADTLDACLRSIKEQTYVNTELLIVDNASVDTTKSIAHKYTSKVYDKGPERSAQRNYGVSKSEGEYLLFIDSDMELSKEVVQACIEQVANVANCKAIIIPEESFGIGFWAKCKSLERSFYIGQSSVEAARFIETNIFSKVGGYDERILGGEDWELSQRVGLNTYIRRVAPLIWHNEGRLELFRSIAKKAYYTNGYTLYFASETAKNANDNKPFAKLLYYYRLYLSHPRKLFKNPLYGFGMLFMKTCEFAVIGFSLVFREKDGERS